MGKELDEGNKTVAGAIDDDIEVSANFGGAVGAVREHRNHRDIGGVPNAVGGFGDGLVRPAIRLQSPERKALRP